MQKALLTLLVQAALVYQTNHTPPELAALSEIFADDLSGEDLQAIRLAFARHRQRSTRFPTPAHILALLPECRTRRGECAALPAAPKTPGMGRLAFEAFKGDEGAKEAMREGMNPDELDRLIRNCLKNAG